MTQAAPRPNPAPPIKGGAPAKPVPATPVRFSDWAAL
jgi:hypothetical protein